MWDDAQRDDRRAIAKYSWRRLLDSLADARYWSAVQ